MPLSKGKSKKSLSKNIATEVKAGKTQSKPLLLPIVCRKKPKRKRDD